MTHKKRGASRAEGAQKEGSFSLILIEGHMFMQFIVVKLILKATDNKFAHVFGNRIKTDSNATHLPHSHGSMLCWQQVQPTYLNKFKHGISLLTTAIVLFDESGSVLAQIGLFWLLIGAD